MEKGCFPIVIVLVFSNSVGTYSLYGPYITTVVMRSIGRPKKPGRIYLFIESIETVSKAHLYALRKRKLFGYIYIYNKRSATYKKELIST